MKERLLIVGNGFDLAHGLHTQYWDFRSYLERNYLEFLLEFEKMYGFYDIDFIDPYMAEDAEEKWKAYLKNMLWGKFEEKMGGPDIIEMIENSDSLLENLGLDGDNFGIQDMLDEYWEHVYGFVNDLGKYVKEWIEQISLEAVKPLKKELIDDNDCIILNFNYTNILEDVYDNYDVCHIHGGVGKDFCIMGHCNYKAIEEHREAEYSAEDIRDEGEASIQTAIVNYLEAIYKDTERIIDENKNFFSRLSKVKDVTIVGWSAGPVDIPYLKKISDCICTDAVWHVYWHDEEAKNMLESAFNQVGIKNKCRDFSQDTEYWDS